MNLFESLSSLEGQYLSYIMDQYSRIIQMPYNKIFVGREANLEILLDDRFDEIKNGVDEQINKIKSGINSIDILNLNKDILEDVAKEMEQLATYLEYLKERMGKTTKISIDDINETAIEQGFDPILLKRFS